MKKKMISLLLVCSMLGTLITGCGSAEPATSDSGAATQQTTETAKADTSDNASSDEQITLTMMFSGVATEGDFETEVLPKLVKEKFPNIDLEVTKLPDDQYYTALKTKLASGECPDIILVQPKYAGSNSVIELAKAGYLLDISDLEFLDKAGDAIGLMKFDILFNAGSLVLKADRKLWIEISSLMEPGLDVFLSESGLFKYCIIGKEIDGGDCLLGGPHRL